MNKYVKKSVVTVLCVLAIFGSAFGMAQAKTVEEWLEGYDTGKDWFGEDMVYDITNEEACWELLMRPIIVLDVAENEKVYPLKTPDGKKVNNDKLGGFINGASSAIHVLGEDEDGWTLIEGMDYYNRIIRGYVKTELIKTVTPSDQYGIIVDKLTQRLYVFEKGHLLTSLIVSTGKPNKDQPYNETSSGEYLIVSWTGALVDERMVCEMALRYNGGDMIHQVPYHVTTDGGKDYSTFEARLGTKASHGCIRVQRDKNTDGYNEEWLWDHLKKYTKVVIWDDAGRPLPYPAETDPVYYNPDGGKYYHSEQNCSSVRSKFLPLSPLVYADLDTTAYTALEPCPYCRPDSRISEIAKENYERDVISKEEYLSKLTPLSYPADSLELYYNPNGGSYYHSTANCTSVKDRFLPLTPFLYGELDTDTFVKLKACPYCFPVKRKAEIDEENRAMGFDEEAALEEIGKEEKPAVTFTILD